MRAAAALMLEQADALLHGLDEFGAEEIEAEAPEFQPVDGCDHPEDKRVDTTTNGPRSFFCPGCRRTSDELNEMKGAA